MAVTMMMSWNGITPAQYDQLREMTHMDDEAPDGCQYHVAAFDDKGIRVTDVWDSAEQFQAFGDDHLLPAVAQLGITSHPSIEIFPVHATLDPR